MLYADPFLTVYCCLLAALLGACMGSFLNCAAWRIVHGESVLRGRSHCDACGHVLAVRDLIPVVSYLAAHGRCRYCGAKLSRRHVLAEAVSALVFVTLLLHYDISLQALEGWCVASILLVCSFADLEGYIIPDRFIAVGVVLFITTLFFDPQPLRRALDGAIGGLAVAGCVLLLVLGMEKLLGREAMGGGDIKLMAVLGLFLGLERGVVCLLTACLLSVAYVLGREFGRRVMKNRRDRSTGAFASADLAGTGAPSLSEPFLSGAIREVSSEHDRDSLLAGTMPFAPFIALGTLVAFVA